jgi:hypothetical protein
LHRATEDEEVKVMDHESFDRITRRLGATGTRRATLGALVGAGLLGFAGGADARNRRRRSRRRLSAQAQPGLRDCPNPRPGQNLSQCDFTGQDLRGRRFAGANLSGADFEAANICGANLRGTGLHNVDLKTTNLTRADLRGTNLSTATTNAATLFCQTIMPNGSINDEDCPVGVPGPICCFDAECPAFNGVATVCQRARCCIPSGVDPGVNPETLCCTGVTINGRCA